jgi:tetratricopeptide (TPR) repeat protein
MKTALSLFVLACLFMLSVPANASDDASLAVTREAFEKYQAVKAEAEQMRERAFAESQAAQTDEEKKEAREYVTKVLKKAAELETAARDAFLAAFAKTDWNAWSTEKDAALLECGLDETAIEAFGKDPAQSVKAWEALLEKLPKCNAAAFARATWLPLALPSTGDLDKALKRIPELLKDVPEDSQPDVLMALGDTRAMAGDYEGAQTEYAKALKLIPEGSDNNTAAGRAKPYLEMRISLLGKAAPEIDSKTWLGGEAKKLSELKGNVVIVNFWATKSSACIGAIPGMDDLYQKHAHEGLKVLGVTHFYDQGYLPADMQELRDGRRNGTVAQKMDEKAFTQHLWDFRERTKVSYPFVMGTLDDMKAYGVTGIPTMLVLDTEGKIAFIAVGGMREHVLRITAERLLKPATK